MNIPDSLKPVVTFFHPVVMAVTFVFAIYVLYLGVQIRRTRSAEGDQKKALIGKKFNLSHFQAGSALLVLIVLGAFGGMAVTYINNGKLFVGAHLLAGLGVAGMAVLSAALAPLMQQGKNWARYTHITINIGLVGIFGWQAITGLEIAQRILTQMAKATA